MWKVKDKKVQKSVNVMAIYTEMYYYQQKQRKKTQ